MGQYGLKAQPYNIDSGRGPWEGSKTPGGPDSAWLGSRGEWHTASGAAPLFAFAQDCHRNDIVKL